MHIVDFDTKTITADNHVVETFRTCEEKARLGLQEHWRPSASAPALAFGIAVHAARASYKQAIMNGHTLANAGEYGLQKGLQIWDAEMPPEMKTEVMQDDKRSRKNFERLVRGYFNKYGGADFQPIHVEVAGKHFLGTTPDGWKFDYVYTIDEVVRHRDKIYPLEFKTHSDIFGPPNDRYFSQFNNKASVTGYIWACEKEFGYDISGAIIHAMWVQGEPKPGYKGKYTLPDYFKMDYSYRDQAQIDEWIHNTLLTGDDIVRSVRENRWKRADGLACVLYNGCSFKKICEATPGIRERLLEIDFVRNEWNPWARQES